MSLSLYKPLGDDDPKTRFNAAKQLTAELTSLLSSEKTDKTKGDVEYALKRLTRGLASGRESARPGFAVVLTELLGALREDENQEKWDVSTDRVIELVKANTHPQEHAKGQEARDYDLGRLFGLQSVIQSGIVFSSQEVLDTYDKVLDLIFELANRKPWLRESCVWSIASSVPTWPRDYSDKLAERSYRKLAQSRLLKTAEGVGIWLQVQAHYPAVTPPKDLWSNNSPLAPGNLGKLSKMLKESTDKDETDAKSKGSWAPKLGFVWDLVLNVYFSDDNVWKDMRKRTGVVAEWPDFWKSVVDEGLFAASSSDERKFWGFLFVHRSLDRATTPTNISALFSKNFMRCLINQLSDEERYLHKLASKTARALVSKSESAAWMAPVIFRQLVSNNGTENFDHITKTKTAEKILMFADEKGLSEIFELLESTIHRPAPGGGDSIKVAEARRQWAADLILAVIRNGKTIKPDELLRQVIKLFTELGYFDVSSRKLVPSPPISAAAQAMFRARLMGCLTHLIGLNGGTTSTGQTWPYLAVDTLRTPEKRPDVKLAIEFDDVMAKELSTATKTATKLWKMRSSKPKSTASQHVAFEMLYSLIVLQVYNGESDALSVLGDLESIRKKVFRAPEKKRQDEDVDPAEVLVDILLSFLSKQSNLLKRLAHTVFISFSGSITKGALKRCFEVLDAKEGIAGQQELFDEDSEGSGSGDDASKMPYGEAQEAGDDDELSSDVEVLSISDESSDEDEEQAKELENALKTALQPGDGSDPDSDADMDDEAMLKIDEHLSKIFKRRKEDKSKRDQKKAAKELIVNFKCKVLELLELYVKSRAASQLALEVLVPCLVCARKTSNQKVAAKCVGVIKTFSHTAKRETLPESLSPYQVEDAWHKLALIHDEAGYGGNGARRSACSSASILVVKTLVKHDVENLGEATALYGRSLSRWGLESDYNVGSSFFNDFAGWIGSVRGSLRKSLTEIDLRVPREQAASNGESRRKRKREGNDTSDASDSEPLVKKSKEGKLRTSRKRKSKSS